MAEEEKIIESIIDKKEPINVWKIALIIILSIGILVCFGINIYNSDWYINKTLNIKEANDLELGKHTTWSYVNKYENNRLKIQVTVKNVDEKVINIANNYWDKKEYIIALIFLDKDKFKLAEVKIPLEDFIQESEIKGQYRSQCSLIMDKKTIRKINEINVQYKEILDYKYEDIMNEIKSNYINTFNNLFDF